MLQDFKKIDDFYPTPDFLIDKMLEKVNLSKVKYILEPSAGKGNIIKKLTEKTYHRIEVNAIEINSELQAVLRGEGYQVIDTDFLSHMGGEMYDLIIANPPFSEGEHYGIGLYNDMTGQPESTEEWFRWINEGGEFDQTHEKKGLSAMKDFWKKFPSGGEFTSSITMKELLDTNLDQTINLIKKAHTTFLGPKVADKTYENGYRKVLGSMGYRLWISQASLIQMPGYVSLNLKWKNDGVAPFYEDWPVWVLVEDEDGNSLEKEAVDISLKSLLPEETLQTKTRMQVKKMISLAGKKYKISIGIEDPMTGKLAVRFSMKGTYNEGKNYLFQ